MDGTVYFYHCRPWQHLATCMALREVGERRYDNAAGSRKLSAVAEGHTIHVKKALPEGIAIWYDTPSNILGVIMKVSEIIQEFVPCKICGNNDIGNFIFYVSADKGPQAYVKCCECKEEYYSISASKILALAEESRIAGIRSRITLKNNYQESVHSLVKVLARI